MYSTGLSEMTLTSHRVVIFRALTLDRFVNSHLIYTKKTWLCTHLPSLILCILLEVRKFNVSNFTDRNCYAMDLK